MYNPAIRWFRWLARRLASRNLIDGERGQRLADLTWPRFVTMLARFSLRISDISMVGLAVGSSAIVGLGFAVVYWQVAFAFGLGLAGGTIGCVAQRYGANQHDEVGLVVKESVILGLGLTLPFVAAYWLGASELIGVFTDDALTIRHGSTYLRASAIALLFVTFNVIASRALAGADNTWIPMTIRATGAVVNIGLNAVLIFGLGLGVFGAALGSVIAEALVSLCFGLGFVRGGLPVVGSFPIRVSVDGPHIDRALIRRLTTVSAPLVGQRLGQVLVRFPVLGLLATIGPTVVASFEVARRVRNLLNAFGAGFSMSVSSLVGQALGRASESQAIGYGRDALVYSVVVYLTSATLVFLLAPDVARLFSRDSATVAATTPFVRIASVSFVGLGVFRTFEGILKGTGQNRWTMYGRLFGLYFVLLPLTYVGASTSFGMLAVFVAVVAETWSAALVTGYRVLGDWARASRPRRSAASVD